MEVYDQLPFKNHWQKYLKLALIPYPASGRYKGPIVAWKNDENGDLLPPPCSDDYEDWEEKYPRANIWVLLGEEFAVIDPDGAGAEDFVKGLGLPQGPTSISGKRSIHRWFKLSSPLKPLKTLTNGDKTFVELRTGNLGMMVPPSIHPDTKQPYRWMEGHSPWEIPFPELPLEAYDKIKSLLPKQEPQPEPRMVAIGNNGFGFLDVEEYLIHYGIKYRVKQDSNRTFYLLDQCLFADQHTTKDTPGDSSIIQGTDGKLGYQCFHSHCASRTWADARKTISGDDPLSQFVMEHVATVQKKEGEAPLLNSAIFEVDHFINITVPAKRQILKPWLTEQSINEIAGWRGVGKTWFGLSIFDSATSGEPFGPWEVDALVPALYIDGELPAQDVQDRFRQLPSHDRRERLYIYSDAYAHTQGLSRANLLSTQWREQIKAIMVEKGIRLLGLDNVSSLAAGIDENSKKDWDPINQWFLDLRFAGIATIFFHHTNKGGDQRGTSGREDHLDSSIVLQRPPVYTADQGAKFIVRFKKSRVQTRDLPRIADVEFTLTEINCHLQWTWGNVKRKIQLEILKMLDEGIPQTDIAKHLGVDKGYVSRVKSKALQDHHLTPKGKLTETGLRVVNESNIEDEI